MATNNYAEINERADWSLIPESMHEAIHAWVELGREPGHFLTAVLKNDLKEAVAHGDEVNTRALPGWVMFLHNYCPYGCWGSLKRMEQWKAVANAHFEQLEREYAETR